VSKSYGEDRDAVSTPELEIARAARSQTDEAIMKRVMAGKVYGTLYGTPENTTPVVD
jgi:hypothetical protein